MERASSYGFEKDWTPLKYSKLYNRAYSSRVSNLDIPEKLKALMKDKKAVGDEKYKEQAFQNSVDNTFQVDIKRHIFDELADMMNYLIHWHICASFLGEKGTQKFFKETTRTLLDIYLNFPSEVGVHLQVKEGF